MHHVPPRYLCSCASRLFDASESRTLCVPGVIDVFFLPLPEEGSILGGMVFPHMGPLPDDRNGVTATVSDKLRRLPGCSDLILRFSAWNPLLRLSSVFSLSLSRQVNLSSHLRTKSAYGPRTYLDEQANRAHTYADDSGMIPSSIHGQQ